MHCEGGLIVKLHSIDYIYQLQVTHPDLSVIKEMVQINMRCIFLLGFLKICLPVKLVIYQWQLKPLCIKLVYKELLYLL